MTDQVVQSGVCSIILHPLFALLLLGLSPFAFALHLFSGPDPLINTALCGFSLHQQCAYDMNQHTSSEFEGSGELSLLEMAHT